MLKESRTVLRPVRKDGTHYLGLCSWIYCVALNTAIAWTRKEDRHQRGKQPLAVVEGLLTTSSSDGHDPRVEWLYRQIAQLKDVDRSVALLLLDGFSYKEIAASGDDQTRHAVPLPSRSTAMTEDRSSMRGKRSSLCASLHPLPDSLK